MSLAPGTRLGAYEIIVLLGAGGMGEVYRATDTHLGRGVAIKVLPEAFANDVERLARFEREAKTLASLNHPNIAIVHGFEKEEGVRALVMELVEGPTLADRIAQGSIPIDEALLIARQIAEALETAHEHGIIHRDLKPANVKVRDDGTVKVLDFGLAKIIESDARTPSSLSMLPTITTPAMTQLGVILGTAAYMAPEQARGKPVDKRSDVWAFGCVLFEMLAGVKAFDGEDATDTIAAVVRGEPRWGALPADLPAQIRLLLRRCLEKDRKKRIGDISTALFIMSEGVLAPSASPASSIASTPLQAAKWRYLAWSALAVAIASLVTAGILWILTRPEPPRVSRLELVTSGPATLEPFVPQSLIAITRKTSWVVYVGGAAAGATRLFARRIDQLDSTLLTGEQAGFPFVSPDGEWIGFFSSSTLKKVAITGGPSQVLARIEGAPRGATWGPDDTIIFATSAPASGLLRVSAKDGGSPAIVTRPDQAKGEGSYVRPWFLPGGQAVLFTIRAGDGTSQVAVIDLQSPGAVPRILVPGGSDARYLPTGHLVYVAGNSLRVVRFDLGRLEVQGSAVEALSSLATVPWGAGQFDVSDDGTLVYRAQEGGATPDRTLAWVDRHGKEEAIPAPPRAYLYPRISPDGTRVAVDVREEENDVWIWELARSSFTKVTKHQSLDRTPVWASDGEYVFFSSTRDGFAAVYRQRADGTGPAEKLTERAFPVSLSPDGQQLVLNQGTGGPAAMDVIALRVDAHARGDSARPSPGPDSQGASLNKDVRTLVKTPAGETNGAISPPDGRWLAYQSNESGNWDVYVRPFRDLERGARSTVSTGGGTQPRWAPNGRELFYLSPRNEMMSVRVSSGETWSAGTPQKLFDASSYFVGGPLNPFYNYDVAKDGRFLMIKPVAESSSEADRSANLIVVQHWFEEVKRMAPDRNR